jgi:hypothetical protein
MFGVAQKIKMRCSESMTSLRAPHLAATVSAFVILAASASSVSTAATQSRINPPPSADLAYSISAKQSGLNVKGDSTIRWRTSDNKYAVTIETNAMMFGKILETSSEGVLASTGLVPTRFTERRYRKPEAVTIFNRTDKTVTYSGSQQPYPLKGGEQDRSSIIWQLASIARTNPGKFKAGSEWTFPVAGRRDIEPWTFRVIQTETIKIPYGELSALHLQKIASPNRDQEIDVWLAPSLDWYPVQLRMSERDGATIEQKLLKVTPAP